MCEWAAKQQGAEELSFPTPHTQISFCKQFFYHCTWLPPKWRACSQVWLLIDLHWIQTKSNLVVLYLCAPWSSLPSFLPPLLLPLFFLHCPPKQTEQQVIRAKSYKLKHSPLLNNHKGNGQLFVKSTALLPLLSSKRECYRSKLYSGEKIF